MPPKKDCPAGKIRNPNTGRCIDANGKIAASLGLGKSPKVSPAKASKSPKAKPKASPKKAPVGKKLKLKKADCLPPNVWYVGNGCYATLSASPKVSPPKSKVSAKPKAKPKSKASPKKAPVGKKNKLKKADCLPPNVWYVGNGCYEPFVVVPKASPKPATPKATPKPATPKATPKAILASPPLTGKEMVNIYADCASKFKKFPKSLQTALGEYKDEDSGYETANSQLWRGKPLSEYTKGLLDGIKKSGHISTRSFTVYRSFFYAAEGDLDAIYAFTKKMQNSAVGDSVDYKGLMSTSAGYDELVGMYSSDDYPEYPLTLVSIIIPKGTRYVCVTDEDDDPEMELLFLPGRLVKVSDGDDIVTKEPAIKLGTWRYESD